MRDQGPGHDRTDAGAAPRRGGSAERERLLTAMVELVGERGYRAATVAALSDRAGVGVERFDAWFGDRESCFLAAYEEVVEPRSIVLGELATGAPDPAAATTAALNYLFAFVTRRPRTARAVLVEVYVAGGAVLAKHQEVLERLSRAVADACRETHPSRHDPPPVTASFIVGAIEESVRRRLAEGREALLWDDLPELTETILGVDEG
jgi:AcrR family transcriptional regulator